MGLLYYQNGIMSSKEGDILKIILGERLKELRQEKGWTQKQVAELRCVSAL